MASPLALALQGTLSPDAVTRRQATAVLDDAQKQPGFAIALLRLAEDAAADLTTRQSAALLFKNFVKRNWKEDDGDIPIPEGDRGQIRANLVHLMASVPPLVQRQLSDSLSLISASDFPDHWPTLLPELVSKLAGGDMLVINGMLETASSIFQRFRDAPDTDDNRRVLQVALAGFAAPLTELVRCVDKQLADALAGGAALPTHRATLLPLLTCLRLACVVFHELNWIDLPEFFEDNLAVWMGHFHRYLALNDARVKPGDDDVEEGPLEALQAAILDCVALYADKYDEEFEPFFATFVQDAWSLLSSASASRIAAPHLDPLVIKAVKFLTSAVSKAQHAAVFGDPATLRAITEKVVVPNLVLRDADEELFDDNAVEFIRRDIEGSDSDTRRRVASDLARALVRTFGEPVTALCMEYATRMLGDYARAPETAYVQKDAAMALFEAVAVKASTQAAGVTAVNERATPVGDFLRAHVLPELVAAATGAAGGGRPAALNERPIVKAACIKFVATFRGQFSAEELATLLPLLVPFLGADSYTVHTYAAAAIERVLGVKDVVPRGGAGAGAAAPARSAAAEQATLRLPASVLSAQLIPVFSALFARMAAPGYPENDYLMRCLMRVTVAGKEQVAPYSQQLIAGLTSVLGRVCANPSNPTYNHYLFETIAALMKHVCGSRPEAVAEFEALLFPPFQLVLVNDVMEFLPYVFQLLAQLLELRPSPPPGESALTDGYKSLLPPLLTAPLWARKGNVPALTQLVCAYLRKGGAHVAASGQLLPLLGVFQKLLATRGQEECAFDVARAVVEGVPWPHVSAHWATILQLLLVKLQESKVVRIARQFVHFAGVTAGAHGPAPLATGLNGLGPGLFHQICESVLVPMANRVASAAARKECVVGFARLLCEPPTAVELLQSRAPLWASLLTAAVELAEPQPSELRAGGRGAAGLPEAGGPAGGGSSSAADAGAGSFVSEEAELEALLVETMAESEYTAAYSRLVFAQQRDRYAFGGSAPEPKKYLAAALGALGASMPGRLPPLVATSPVAATIAAYCASAGVGLV